MIVMPKKRASGPRCVEVSEPWLMEWFEWGYRCLGEYLAIQAAFTQWCAVNHREEII